MLEVIYGLRKKLGAIQDLENIIKQIQKVEGTLYFGYPIYSTIDEKNNVDAMLVSQAHGVILFNVNEDAVDKPGDKERIIEESQALQDILLNSIKSKLLNQRELISKRKLAVPINTITYCPHIINAETEIDGFYFFTNQEQFKNIVKKIPPLEDKYYRPLNAVLQLITNYKPKKKRTKAVTANSRGNILKQIEKEMANLDRWQKKAALEITNKPQRIRGLAGSGKTIVLALKAAYLHSLKPDINIAVTFNTRSLYPQFEDLIRRFTFENINDEPDWSKIHLIHAWGSESQKGMYSNIAKAYDQPFYNFQNARQKFGITDAFKGACSELYKHIKPLDDNPLYDVILIDEAQDLPSDFFRLCYKVLTSDKHIVWAYDELQHLGRHSEETSEKLLTENLFGSENGEPCVKLENRPGKPIEDIVLKVCYRNTPWALTLAHSLGFGIYRDKGFVQFFDEPDLWLEIGYEVVKGKLDFNNKVNIRRDRELIPKYFEAPFNKEDAIKCKKFSSMNAQYKWLAREIEKNLEQDELEYSDILIISPDPYTFKRDMKDLSKNLYEKNIDSHLAGITSSRDEFFIEDSVVISGIHRAKGNEAPMVYIVNAEYCFDDWELSKVRNILFTAITRSKAWVRIYGVGEKMDQLIEEIDRVRNNNYVLNFKYPTSKMIDKMKKIHRDKTGPEKKALSSLKDVIDMLQSGSISTDDIEPSLKEQLLDMFSDDRD